jgi:hypothetical protein
VTWTHLPRLGRIAAISVALGLFLVGSNYCVIGAVRGTPMLCTSIGAAQSVKSESAAPICPLHAAKTKGAPASKSPAQGAAPCCVTLARADAPELPRIDVAPMPFATLAVIVAALAPEAPASAAHLLPSEEQSPPTGWEKCAHAGRAPPTLA